MFTSAYPKTIALKDGRQVAVRLLAAGDYDRLHTFFIELPDEDRLFLRHDVRDPNLIRQWTENIDLERIIPLVAEDDGRIVAVGTLHMTTHGWLQHVGLVRGVTARTHRTLGLATLITRELVAIAEDRNLEKLWAHVIEDDLASVRLFEAAGFEKAAAVKHLVKDQNGHMRNLAIMINDVANLSRIIEDWIQDSILPAYRAGA